MSIWTQISREIKKVSLVTIGYLSNSIWLASTLVAMFIFKYLVMQNDQVKYMLKVQLF